MFNPKRLFVKLLIYCLIMGMFSPVASVLAHTDSIGYNSTGVSGSMEFWYGNWHPGTTFNEGSIKLEAVSGSSYVTTTQLFNMLSATQPNRLINGINYFTSNGTALVAWGAGRNSYTWQGATFTGLTTGRYRFTYMPIANPTANWNPMDSVILSSEFDITADLIASSGPSTADTQQSLVNAASVLQSAFALQNSMMVNGFTFDCSLFNKYGVCVSTGGRYVTTQAQGLNNGSGLLIAAYRLDKNNSRLGAWVDQSFAVTAPSSTKPNNGTPMFGVFGVWSQRPDGVGAEVKVSGAYGQRDTTIARQIIGTSEPGSGSSALISQGAQIVAKYGFGVLSDVVIAPYAGMRYTQTNMGGFTEGASDAVTAPLTYAALKTNATTALAGLEARYRGIPNTTLMMSGGIETDVMTHYGTLSATGVDGLTPVNFNNNPARTRPTGSAGAYYDILPNQRLGVTGIYRQEPFQAISTTTVFATYTIAM